MRTNFNKLAIQMARGRNIDLEFMYYLRVNDGVEKFKTLFTSHGSRPLRSLYSSH